MNARATWKGSLHVSLLAVRVKAYSSAAPEQETIHLHQLHRNCQSRIRYQKVCPVHGPLASDQIVMGYEHAPHQHVQVDLSELDHFRSSHELRAIRIDTFVDQGRITPLYYGEKHYYLLPDGPTAQLPYGLLVQAMLTRGAEAVAQVILSKREQLVLLRPVRQRLLVMTCLKYAAQVRSPEAFAGQLGDPPSLAEEELKLAESLVAKRTCQDFDLARYKDEYAEKLAQLVDAKVQGRQLPAAKQDEPNPVFSLMQALQASVEQVSPSANGNGSAQKRLASQLKRNGQRKPRAVKTAVRRKRPRKKSA